jgi:hypothetical protein
VLALMAEGRSNAGIGRRLWITEGTVEKHVHISAVVRSRAFTPRCGIDAEYDDGLAAARGAPPSTIAPTGSPPIPSVSPRVGVPLLLGSWRADGGAGSPV